MSLLFESYEQDFLRTQGIAHKALNNFHLINDNEKQNVMDITKRNITAVERSLKQMEMEYIGKDKSTKQQLQIKIKKYRDSYEETLKKLHNTEREHLDRLEQLRLFDRKDSSKMEVSDRLRAGNEKVYNQNTQFNELNRVAHETEQNAASIAANLGQQRNKILEGMNIGKELGQELSRADKMVTILRNKELFSKLLLWVLAFLLAITDLALLVYRIKR